MFLPVINVNGGTPVDWWGVARAAISTRGSLISQSFWLVATYYFNMLTTVLLARSTWPEEIEWWLIWSLACIPRSFHTSCMISAVKWVPRSELTLKGSPHLEKMWFINRQAVVSAVSLGAGRHSPLCEFANHGEEVFITPCWPWQGSYPVYLEVRPWKGHSFPLQWCSVVWICRLELATPQLYFVGCSQL